MAAANCRMLHVPETRRYSLPYSSGDLQTCDSSLGFGELRVESPEDIHEEFCMR